MTHMIACIYRIRFFFFKLKIHKCVQSRVCIKCAKKMFEDLAISFLNIYPTSCVSKHK